jgi:hypothetical protein
MSISRKCLLGRGSCTLLAVVMFVSIVLLVGCSTVGQEGLGSGGQGQGSSINLTLINNCSGDSLQVLVNTDGVWTSGGTTKCAGGATCMVAPGTYPLDLGSSGLDFFVGTSPDNATKAEVTYLDVLTYDISVISTSGCPAGCGEPSCCMNGFNQSLKITTNPSCRCVYCDSISCPDAYHWPHDDVKQVRCDPESSVQGLTIEFCPANACPSTGFSDCSAAQQAICFNPADQPCTGNKAICCPETTFGATHGCYCETMEAFCATAPDAGSGCGSDASNYCYVAFPPE